MRKALPVTTEVRDLDVNAVLAETGELRFEVVGECG
jgi:hypothetical protein